MAKKWGSFKKKIEGKSVLLLLKTNAALQSALETGNGPFEAVSLNLLSFYYLSL
jgi:hypothetical protein